MFDFFKKKKKVELTTEQLKWNKLWDLWTEEKVDSPYQELMTYQSEINNGGHSQYFTNIANCADIENELVVLKQILSETMKSNLQLAYKYHLTLEENEDDKKAEETLEQCDEVFYENEDEIIKILEEYAAKIEL